MTVPQRRGSGKDLSAVPRPFSLLAALLRSVSTPPALLNPPSREGATVTSGLLSLNPIGRDLGSRWRGGKGEGGGEGRRGGWVGRRLTLKKSTAKEPEQCWVEGGGGKGELRLQGRGGLLKRAVWVVGVVGGRRGH